MNKQIIMPFDVYAMLGFPMPNVQPLERKEKIYAGSDYQDESKKESVLTNSNYLELGERILDLSRKKSYHVHAIDLFEEVDILKLHYNQIPKDEWKRLDYLIKVIKKYVKEKLASIASWEAFQRDGLSFLRLLIGSYIDQIQIIGPDESDNYGISLCESAFKCNFALQLRFNDYPDFSCYGGVGSTRRKKSGYYFFKNRENHRRICLVDMDELIAYLALFNCMYALIKNSDNDLIKNYLEHRIEEVNGQCYEREYEQLISLSRDLKPVSVKFLFDTTFLKKAAQEVLQFRPSKSISMALALAFFDMLQLYQDIVYEKRYRVQSQHQSTPPYITKKNIPMKVLHAMEVSKFNEYFGYVEFDEEMDMKAVQLIEREFERMNREYFFNIIFKNVILRFRKLGRQKAGGLYYYSINTLCVDIRSPGSFIHEYFHMIDDQLDDISLLANFNGVVCAYRNSFRIHMLNLLPEKQDVLNGKSKYNMQYYFRRTEIFARCGEIFLSRILYVESSLLKPLNTDNVAYPEDEHLNLEIERYYKTLFENLKNNKNVQRCDNKLSQL